MTKPSESLPGKSSGVSWKARDPKNGPLQPSAPSRVSVAKPLQIDQIQTEPIRSILRQAGKVLNVRGKQFHNLVDVNLSDEETEPSTPPSMLCGPPTSVSLRRAFGIEEPSRSGQSAMDFFDDRWLEFHAPTESSSSAPRKARRRQLQPVLDHPVASLRRPWNVFICDNSYQPPDRACPLSDPRQLAPDSPNPARYYSGF